MNEGLKLSHHLVVAKYPQAKQRKWLDAALGDGEEIWSVARLRAAIRAGKDPIETRWWVLVEVADKAAQAAYLKQLELEGRTCRPVTRRHYDA